MANQQQSGSVLARLVKELFLAETGEVRNEFKPCAIHLERLDQLLIVYQDCSYIEQPTDGNVSILRGNHGENLDKVVGVIIYHWSELKKNF